MIRKFAVALFAASTLSSSIAMALGLGEAKVSSTLNQPLEAEIELVSVRDLSTAEILPTLASPGDFQRAGVERVHFLSDLNFKVVFRDANKAVIKVTSKKPVREPFLNFMVEVVWPSGRLLREYALLIDPPMFAPSRPTTIVAARGDQVAVPAADARSERRSSGSAPRSQGGNTSVASGTYGPTTRDDTLWGIAAQNRPGRSVSTQQTMLAIQDLNPDAFIDGNINKLKAGQILRMPELSDAQRRTFEQAVSEVSAQNRALAENRALGRRQLDSQSSSPDMAASNVRQGGVELKIVAAEDLDAEPAAGQSGGSKDGRANGTGSNVNAKLTDTLEKLDKTNRENQELQGRLQELESQLQTLQRLVSLKDDQLAALQGQTAQVNEQSVDATEADDSTFADASAQALEGSEGTDVVAGEALADQPVATEVDVSAVEEPVAEPVADVAEVAPVAQSKDVLPEPEPTLLERLMTDPMHQAFAGGGVALVLIMFWLVSRRSREEQDSDEGLVYSSETGSSMPGDDVLNLVGGVGATAAVAGAAGRVAGEENDALDEAGIYVAYGRLDQAAQLLETALEDQPERTDARVKLLEIYAQAGNTSAFEQHFAVLQASGDEDAIQRAEMMRGQLPDAAWDEGVQEEPEISLDDLENQLMSGSNQFQVPESNTQDEVADEIAEHTEEEPQAAAVSGQDDELDESLFTLDESAMASDTAVSAGAAESEVDNLDVEFDISELDLDDVTTAVAGTEPAAQADDFEAALDLEVALDLESEEVATLDAVADNDLNVSEADLELGGFDLDLEDDLELGALSETAEDELEIASEPAVALDGELESELELDALDTDEEAAPTLEADAELELESDLTLEAEAEEVLSDEEIAEL